MLISYAQVPLDRVSAARKDSDWVAAQLSNASTRIVCVHQSRNLLSHAGDVPEPVILERGQAEALLAAGRKPVLLGSDDSVACFALDLSLCDERQLPLPAHSEFIDLRQVGPLLASDQAALLAYARGLTYWHAHNQFCGNCGAPTYGQNGGHSRRCSNDACERDIFPRTDPAVIMLIEDRSNPDNPRCLLGRNRRFAARMFSTLAGFVDPGETLEETVAREVFEEAGVRVGNIRYQASQPWPFPSSIMLGFRASAITTDINIDDDEIEEAYWFSAKEVQTFGEWGDGGTNNCLPRKDSIARFLIDAWVADVLA